MDFYTESNNRFFRLLEATDVSQPSSPYLRGFDFGSLDDGLKELPQGPGKMSEAKIDIRKGMAAEPLDDPSKIKDEKEKSPAEKTGRLIHGSTVKGIQKDDGSEWDLESLKKLLTTKPKEMLNQNDKMKKSGGGKSVFFNFSIPAYHGIYFNEKDDKFELVRTCPSAGACKAFCYAVKGFYLVFPGAALKTGQLLNYLINHPEDFKNSMIAEIKKKAQAASAKRKKFVVCWHDSGDAFNEAYMNLIFDIAKATPDVKHYTYTKQISQFKNTDLPKNFIVNFSKGGTQDKSIESSDKQSIVIPKPLFADLELSRDSDVDKLKDAVSKKYGFDKSSVISYDELMKKPEESEPKWNVLVWHGHGDDSATRLDVMNTLLLIH